MSAAEMTAPASRPRRAWLVPMAARVEALALPLAALVAGLLAFSLFLLCLGRNPADFYALVYKAGFGTWFSWQNTLSRASPLLFAALCVAVPARLGLVVIGGEGAIVLGGVFTGGLAVHLGALPAIPAMVILAFGAALTGAVWIGAVGALRHYRGVNETIASLLMAYIAIALMNHLVEGPLRDPASLNKPSTHPIPDAFHVGDIPGWQVHWGLVVALAGCVLAWVLIERTTWGFAARVAGGNIRAAEVQGLPVGRLIVGFTALGGAFAGLAGYFEVSAVHGTANASLAAGYGYTGILIAFLARQNPLAIVPVAILLAGIEASSGLVQRRMQLPDATMLVLEGFVFMAILISETFAGRLNLARFLARGDR